MEQIDPKTTARGPLFVMRVPTLGCATVGWRLKNDAHRVAARARRLPGAVSARAALVPSVRLASPYTMVRTNTLFDLGRQVDRILDAHLSGAFVECGVWRGGCSFLMADLLQRRQDGRHVWMFDSFEGMPPTAPIDGSAAHKWEATDDPGTNNATASLQEVEHAAELLRLGNVVIVKGWFEETLPARRNEIGAIALLRLDCDWHASVTTCLEQLYDQVVPGGYVLIDDYYSFDGCAIAVHEFLGRRSLPHRLYGGSGRTYFRKL